MYLKFFRLNRLPFALSPDPAFLFLSAGHLSLLRNLRAALATGSGVVVATGDRGLGKTLILEALFAEADPRIAIARIDFPPPALTDLAQAVARQLDLPLDGQQLPRTTDDFARVLASWCAQKPGLALCFDNAHLLGDVVMAAIRAVAHSGRTAGPRIILLGRPLARDRVSTATERLTLAPLRVEELPPYVEHRLAVAGWTGPAIFHEDTYVEIARQSRCTPRIVNALCDSALSIGCERELRQIRLPEIQRAMEDVGRLYSADQELASPASPAADARADMTAADAAEVYARVRLLHKGVPILERNLIRGRLQIGRAPDSDLQIESHFVSRHHCQVVTNEELSIIEDVKSTNGLYVNDRRVRYHRLRDGDIALIGEHELRYEDLRRRS